MKATIWAAIGLVVVAVQLVMALSGIVCMWFENWHPASVLLLFAWSLTGLEEWAEKRYRRAFSREFERKLFAPPRLP